MKSRAMSQVTGYPRRNREILCHKYKELSITLLEAYPAKLQKIPETGFLQSELTLGEVGLQMAIITKHTKRTNKGELGLQMAIINKHTKRTNNSKEWQFMQQVEELTPKDWCKIPIHRDIIMIFQKTKK